MNFAEWTKQQQKKNGGSQTGTSRPTTTASTISFSDWTKQKHGVQTERPVAAPKTEVPSVADKYTAPASTKVDNSKRIGELETKIGSVEKDIGNLRVGASRARAYGGAAAIEKQLSAKQKELADLQAELFTLRDAAAETAREKAEVRQDRAKVDTKKTGSAVPIGEAAGRSAAAKMLNDPKAKKEFSDNIEKHNAARQELAAANRVVGMYDYVDKYEDKAYKDNFWGQTGANYTLGRMTQDSSLAWSEYLNNPTDENRKYAESIDALLEKFMENNEDTLADDGTLRLISQSGANYLPQLIDQTKYSAIGGVAGALGGSVIPGVGTAAGLKAGIVAGSGVYSYNTMRGAAFKTLIDLGVGEETARAAANDEAVISSLIEMGDTAIDLLTLGASKLLTAAGKQGLKGLGAVLTKWAGESAAKKFGLALGKYGLNIFSEGIEEGLQQSVSLANQQRIVNGEGGGVGDLIGRSASVLWDAAMGKNADAAEEILGASKEGMKIAALMGGADAAVSGTATAINKRLSAKHEAGTESKEQAGAASAASKEPTAPNAGKTAVKPEADPVVAEQQAPAATVETAEQQAPAVTVETAEQQTAQEAWNQAAARAFGETGAKAFQTVNDGSIDSEALYAGFAVYHHAGMTGRDMNTITSQYAKNMPEDLRKIAYDAGVQDAAASVKARTEAAATATVYGKDAGVIANDYSKSMDQDVVRTLDRVAKSLGRKVVVEDLGDSNGLLDSDGVIHVDIHAENPHLVVAAHEVSHVMEDMAPAQHKRYRDYVLNKMADVNGGSILELVEAQKAAYAGKQILSDEQAMNELVADYTARMMKDRNLFAEFAQKDRTAAQKLLDAVKKFLQKVKAVFSGNRQAQNEAAQREFGMDISMVEEAAKLWQEALTASQAQAQTANKNTVQKTGVEVRYSKKVSSLTEADVRDLLEACINGEFPDGSYIPIRRNTPAILLEKVQEHSNGEVMAENLPIIMSVGKVRQAMDEEDGASYGSNRPHGISDDGMIELIKKMDDPAYIVYQIDNGRYSEVVRYRDKKTGKETLTVMDFGNNKKASYMNGYEGGTYNVLVTTYNPDSLQSYLAKNEVIYDKKKDAPQRGSGSILPSHLNGSPFADMVTQETGKSNTKSSIKGGSVVDAAVARAEDVDALKRQVEYWKNQVKQTKGFKVNAKDVEKLAKQLIRNYKVDTDTDALIKKMQDLYDGIATGYYGNKEIDYETAQARSEEIAKIIVEDAVETENEMYVEYAELRKYLRSTTLNISTEDSHDIPDFNYFRKRNMGRMRIGTKGTNIDTVYKEMATLWPEFFTEENETTPSDQLLRIAEVMEGVYRTQDVNPFGRYAEEAVSDIADEVLAYFFTLPQAQTFADKAAARLKQATADARLAGQMAQGRRDAALLRRSEELAARAQQRAADALAKEKQRGAEAVQKLKDTQAAKTAKTREQRKAAELRGKIIRHSRDMSQKLLRPTDKKHVPEELRGAVAMLLDAINLESQYTIGPDGKRVKNGDGSPTKRTEAFMRLRQEYEKITKSDQPYNLVIDPDLMDNITELSEMRDIRLADMNTEQLATVWSALRAVEASIQSANKAFGAGRFETISEYAEGIRVDNRGRNDRGNLRGILGGLDKVVNLEMLTPEAYFHRLGETASEIFRMLRSAQDQHVTIMEQARRATFRITRSENIEKLEKQIHHVKLSGDREVVMSTAQIMSLYELLKREKAQEHILVGGIRPDALQQKGLKEVARSEPYKVTLEDCMEICGILTKEQMEMADKLQRYLGEELSDLGNQASMEVYGYRKFNEPNYFPIKVDQNQTKSDAAKQAQAATIAGRGFTKSVAPKAKNAVMIGSIFDVYAAHVNDMATYAAWLAPMENLRRIRDFSFWVEGVQTGNVKAIIERVFGKHGNAYLNKLIDDINQGVQAKDGGNLTDGLIGNYKAASVAANLRVFLQQPTAILRALDMIDPKYLAKGAVRKGDFEKVKKYAPIAIWKDWGYFDINTGRQMKNVLFDFDTKLEKVKQIAMAPAGKADSFAWARLWNAVEAEVKDQQSRLKPGTDAFYRAVAERFSEIVDRTQVVDGILQRSQIMRRPDAYAKMTTSFMAEPTKIYNMFASAAYDLKYASGKENRKKAGKALARTTFALVTSFAVNAVMQSIADALRDDDKERDYWEKFSEAYVENFFASFNPAGYIPYARDVLSIAQGYDVSRMDMEPVSRVWDAASQMVKALKGEGKYTIAGSSANLLAEASRLLGVPVANLKRDIHGVILTAAIETDNYLLQYRIDKALLNMGYAQNKKNFMDILYNAMVNDDEAYRIIVADMVRNGTSEEDIRNAMENRMKVAQGVTSVADLSSRYLTPNQEKEYDKAYSRVTGTQVWKSATEEQREKLEGNLYDLTVGNGAGEDLREKIEPGRDVGIDEVEYLLYKLAQEVVSEDGNKNTSQAEAEAAAELLTGLSKDEQAWLWQSTNKGWKSKNNPFN